MSNHFGEEVLGGAGQDDGGHEVAIGFDQPGRPGDESVGRFLGRWVDGGFF